eukprot:CAMPEP_0114629724 /NCGR_PEP_ID=MMETSP0168-20121206/13511_1 /TAXON_ID=95228 ORGANISM="Vannella sp., Strain DIVA3 517/6/12" /NCGR_SAMPLE_ID=MMETSP0168 /ASSEMBLY_ACC=CAM_ASM_000044 /LENGTH=325 /DNA_ID=CAMNT_0001841201 /DNA_START=83 /DNA_END=1060 /DNA_ORIENTATION=+
MDTVVTNVVHGGGNGTVSVTAPPYDQGLTIVCRANFTHTITAYGVTVGSMVKDGDEFVSALTLPACAANVNNTLDFDIALACQDLPISMYCTDTTVISYTITVSSYPVALGTIQGAPMFFSARAANMYDTSMENGNSSQYIAVQVGAPLALDDDDMNAIVVTVTSTTETSSQQLLQQVTDRMQLGIIPTSEFQSLACPSLAAVSESAQMRPGAKSIIQSTYTWQFVAEGQDRDDGDNNLVSGATYMIIIDAGISVKDLSVVAYLTQIPNDHSGMAVWAAFLWSMASFVLGIGLGFVLTIVGIIGLRQMNKRKAEEFDREFSDDQF